MAAACVVCSEGKLSELSWLRCSIVGRGRATINLTTDGSAALPAAITTRARSSAGRFHWRNSRKAIESGASSANEPASLTIPAMAVTVGSRWLAMACMACTSKPGAHALTAMPADAVMTASPSRMARTRTPKAVNAARLSIVVREGRGRDHAQPTADDVERARDPAGDLAVQRHVHRIGGYHPEARDLQRAKAADRSLDAKRRVQGGAKQASHRQVFDHEHVQRSVVRGGARNFEVEEAAEDRGVDDSKMDEAQALELPFVLDQAAEDRPLPQCHGGGGGVG